VLEQRDRYNEERMNDMLTAVHQRRAKYQQLMASHLCVDGAEQASDEKDRPAAEVIGGRGLKCQEIKHLMYNNTNTLFMTEQDLIFRMANLKDYYAQYIDGITRKTPKIIFLLRVLDSELPLLALWGRLPFEVLAVFLLLCMGALGGVISVTYSYTNPRLISPKTVDWFYRPMAGGAIALAIYVLFRAAQLGLGVQNQDEGTGASLSIYLLAALGLASGIAVDEAIQTIQDSANRLLRRRKDAPNSPGAAN
jgi:hypothetical protein